MTIDDTLSALEAIKPVPATAYEVGIHPNKLQSLAFRGLLETNVIKRHPTIYYLSERGRALIELMNAPVVPVRVVGAVGRIQKTVADRFGLSLSAMLGPCRSRRIARARQIAMFLVRELTPLSLPNIGRRFGGRDHTTILHGIRTVKSLIAADPVFAARVNSLRRELLV